MKKQVAVYYDFQNVYDYSIDKEEYLDQIEFIEDYCKKLGKITIKNLYLKEGKYNDEENILQLHKNKYNYQIKFGEYNKDIDTLMASDFMDDSIKDNFDICVIISGDTDFVPPITKIRERAKEVHVLCNMGTYRKYRGISENCSVFQILPEKCRKCNGEAFIVEKCMKCDGTGELISECNRCEGTGWSIGAFCIRCKGTGWDVDRCKHCKGAGILNLKDCSICDGTGNVEEECENCGGLGKTGSECYICQGTGIYRSNECSLCEGRGIIDLKKREICSTCKGTGIYSVQECYTCEGSGKFKKNCWVCKGEGYVTYHAQNNEK